MGVNLNNTQLSVMKELVKHELKESKSFYEKADVVAVKRTLIEIWDILEKEEDKNRQTNSRRQSRRPSKS